MQPVIRQLSDFDPVLFDAVLVVALPGLFMFLDLTKQLITQEYHITADDLLLTADWLFLSSHSIS